jgi:hypothetical protein
MKQVWCFSIMAVSVAAPQAWSQLPVQALVLSDDPAPGIVNSGRYDFFTIAGGAADGERIAFGCLLDSPDVNGGNDIASYYGPPTAPVLTAREGSPPDLSPSGEYFDFLRPPSINASGTVLSFGQLSWIGGAVGAYRRSANGTFEKIIETNDSVDGLSDRRLDKQIQGNRAAIDGAGNAYLIADLYGSNINTNNKVAILRAAPGNATTLVRKGVTAPPGVPNPSSIIFFSTFLYLNANDPGNIAFIGFLSNSMGSADSGIWTDAPGALSLLVREGDPAPGITNATFSEFPNAVGIGDDGTVGFCARLGGTGITANDELTVWTGRPGALKLVAREGDPAPGLGNNVVFDTFLQASSETGPAVNPYGHAAFVARLRGPGITTGNDDTIWVEDGDGTLRLVVREGSNLPGSGSTTAAIGTSNPALFAPFTLHPVGGFASTTRVVFAAETAAGANEGIYAATIPDETTSPTIRINGPKRRLTSRPSLRLSGSASDNLILSGIEVKAGAAPSKRAVGTARWSTIVRLKSGTTRITATALDRAGNLSAPAKVIVKKL